MKLRMWKQAVWANGVLPPGFRFPDDSRIWMRGELYPRLPSRTAHNWNVVGRLRDGIGLEQAHAELATHARQIKEQYGQDVDMIDVAVARLQDAMTTVIRPALLICLAPVTLVRVMACP